MYRLACRRKSSEWRGQVAEEPPLVGDFDHRWAVAIERFAEGGTEFLRPAGAAAGYSEGGRELDEVGVVEVDIDIACVVNALLDVLDRAVGRVVVDNGDRSQPVPDRRRQLSRS